MERDQLTAAVDRLESEMRRAFLRDGSIMAMGTVMDAVGRVADVVPHTGGGFVEALCASCERHRAAAVWIAAEAWSAFERPGSCRRKQMKKLTKLEVRPEEIAEIVHRCDAYGELIEALSFYVSLCGNTGYSITRDGAHQAYELADAVLTKCEQAQKARAARNDGPAAAPPAPQAFLLARAGPGPE